MCFLVIENEMQWFISVADLIEIRDSSPATSLCKSGLRVRGMANKM